MFLIMLYKYFDKFLIIVFKKDIFYRKLDLYMLSSSIYDLRLFGYVFCWRCVLSIFENKMFDREIKK